MIKAEIKDSELKEHLDILEEDKLRIFTMAEGRIRGAIFHGTRFVNTLRFQHNLGILETYILGHAALNAALTIPMAKDLEHTVIRFEGTGLSGGYSVESDSTGYVRGYLQNKNILISEPLKNWDLKPFLGVGNLTFQRIHKDDKYPQISTVAVAGESIAKDFASYFAKSEQIKTAFNSSIQFDKTGKVIGAGAMYIQLMPKTGGNGRLGSQIDSHAKESEEEENLLQKVESAFSACPSLGAIYSEKEIDSEDIVMGLFREFKPLITLARDIRFDCPCNKEQFLKYLRCLPKKDLLELKKDSSIPLEIVCENCSSIYHIPVEEI